MAGPIYKLFQARVTEAWYELSAQEQKHLSAQVDAAREQVGGRVVVPACLSLWANEEWGVFGIEAFSDAEAVQKHTDLLDDLNWYRYIESRTTLGTLPDGMQEGHLPAAQGATAGGPVYKLFQARFTEAWYRLSADEQQHMAAQVEGTLEQVGGRRVVICASLWANEQWGGFGVEVFPDVAAVQKHTELLITLNWYRFVVGRTTLGTVLPAMS